jgi:hypothetical protein
LTAGEFVGETNKRAVPRPKANLAGALYFFRRLTFSAPQPRARCTLPEPSPGPNPSPLFPRLGEFVRSRDRTAALERIRRKRRKRRERSPRPAKASANRIPSMSALFKPPGPGGSSYLAPQPGREMNGNGAALTPTASAYSAPNSGDDRRSPQTTTPFSRATDVTQPKQGNVPASTRAETRAPADNSTVLSDADPETWIPGAQYAQGSIRRSGGGLQWRDLSPLEGMRVALYDSAFRTLKELEPNHPQLQSLSTSTWVPTFSDTNRLNEEIARIRARRELPDLESHHNFPRQFSPQFRACGIDPEDYLTFLPRPFHRLRPDGLHTDSVNWNAQWKRFLSEQPTAKPEDLLKQLHGLWKNVPWLDR